eukprot:Sspe_Gene.34297::Locus_16691_Transcript_1_1_Confidence_1.000_Length_1558::g.34297::m.34297/K02358/tuf, TUFM; elongation factor Tu
MRASRLRCGRRTFRSSCPLKAPLPSRGRGVVCTGSVEVGTLKVKDKVELVGFKSVPTPAVVGGLESFCKVLDKAEAGDNVGVLCTGVSTKDAQRGMVLGAPGATTPCCHFKANVYILSEEEGGRSKPFFQHYRPQFFFRTADITGDIDFPETIGQKQEVSKKDRKAAGTEGASVDGDFIMVMPGDNREIQVTLAFPAPLVEGQHFAFREGNRTVGHGVVTKILPPRPEGEVNFQRVKKAFRQ